MRISDLLIGSRFKPWKFSRSAPPNKSNWLYRYCQTWNENSQANDTASGHNSYVHCFSAKCKESHMFSRSTAYHRFYAIVTFKTMNLLLCSLHCPTLPCITQVDLYYIIIPLSLGTLFWYHKRLRKEYSLPNKQISYGSKVIICFLYVVDLSFYSRLFEIISFFKKYCSTFFFIWYMRDKKVVEKCVSDASK